MIFDSDMVIAIVILTVGMAFYTSSLVEHGGMYGDTIKTNIFHDKVSSQLKEMVTDGTIDNSNPTDEFVLVSTVVLINRSEGWYGFYWNESLNPNVNSRGPFIDENIAYAVLGTYDSDYNKTIYYYNNNESIDISLKVYGE